MDGELTLEYTAIASLRNSDDDDVRYIGETAWIYKSSNEMEQGLWLQRK
jgi:hypothetical protein